MMVRAVGNAFENLIKCVKVEEQQKRTLVDGGNMIQHMSLNRKSAPASHWLIKQKHCVRQACAESKNWTL